jgi:hypothetical protein
MSPRFVRLRTLSVAALAAAALTVGCADEDPATTIEGEEEQPVPGEPDAPDPIGPEGEGDDPATDAEDEDLGGQEEEED